MAARRITRVEFQIEGKPEDGGAVRLPALNVFLSEIRKSLAAVEREITGQDQTVAGFKLVHVSYASPVKFIFEPIISKKQPMLGTRVVERFTKEINEVKAGREPKGILPQTLEQFEKLSELRGKQVTNFSVGLEGTSEPLPLDFNDNLRRLLSNIYRSHGSFRGRIEAVNIHSNPSIVYLYPVIGPNKVRCVYPKGRFPQIGEYLGKTVDTFGVLKFRGDAPHPYEIVIEHINVLPKYHGERLADSIIGSMPDITDGKDIQTFLTELRNGTTST